MPPDAQNPKRHGSSQIPFQIPLVIAHRGASGDRPENTLASFAHAIDLGADYLELDVMPTRDGVLIVCHDNELSATTDITHQPEFTHRKTTKRMEGHLLTGWFTEDFTYADIQRLRVRERFACRNQAFNGRFGIPTLEEVIQLVKQKTAQTRKTAGLYLEIKHPSYFRAVGLPIEPMVLDCLTRWGYTGSDAPVILESFEPQSLRTLRQHTDLPISQLLGKAHEHAADSNQPYGSFVTTDGLRAIADYANGISPAKGLIVLPHLDDATELGLPTSLIADAHAQGLWVHAYTFRSEPQFLHPAYRGNPQVEYQQFFELGVDGVFSDAPDQAIRARGQRFY
ncbi:MAG: glycerophosphodiester phosphodiesterase family protein [Elainellaceae cyanobacterium]